jgi:hypothetical protein
MAERYIDSAEELLRKKQEAEAAASSAPAPLAQATPTELKKQRSLIDRLRPNRPYTREDQAFDTK